MNSSLAPGTVLLTVLVCVFFFATGAIALMWPERIQSSTLTFYEEAHGLAKWNPLRNWMRTSSYVVSLRIVGALSIAAGCVIVLVVLRGGA